MKLLALEFCKCRRRKLTLVCAGLLAAQLLWFGVYLTRQDAEALAQGWMLLLYNLAMVDAIMLPIGVAVIASRSCELEHRGHTLKLLETAVTPGRLYAAKLAWGALVLAGLLLVRGALFLALGLAMGFPGGTPWGRFVVFTALSWAVSMTLYALQQGLSLRFANQAVALVCGIFGSFVGLMALLFPVWVQRCVPWGYYGLFPAVLGTFNYLGNLEVLDAGWYSLWTQHTLFASMFFLPAQFGVFCAWQWRLEHADHNWNAALTAPVPVRALYLGKLLLDVGVSALAMALIGLLFLLSGRLAGISAPLPPELPGWLAFGALGCTAVCAVQLYLSLAIRAFAPPVAIALVGGIFGLLLTSQGFGAAFPYSLLCLGMRANNPQMALPLPSFLAGCGFYLLLFSLLAVRRLSRRDAATG